MYQGTRVAQFEGVTEDKTITLNGRKFRVLLYSALNANGLIGPEFNGIAVLDEDDKKVIVDNIEKQDSGYFGPSEKQKAKFEEICQMKFKEFQELVNSSDRCREPI